MYCYMFKPGIVKNSEAQFVAGSPGIHEELSFTLDARIYDYAPFSLNGFGFTLTVSHPHIFPKVTTSPVYLAQE